MNTGEVLLIDGPGRRGHPAGHLRERPDGKVYPVRWHDNTTSSVPEYDLDQVAAHRDDVFSVLKNKRFGRLNDLRRNLTFVYLSGKLANVVYSTDTTNTDFYAYQYEPFLTFLESPAGGILIAAEVGLGKTIEAGLIWTELRARYDARRLVVVCPAMLREKWCDELRERFGVDAVQLSASELVNELKRNKHRRRRGGFRVQPARSATAQGLEKP